MSEQSNAPEMPKKYNFAEVEPRWREKWEGLGIYAYDPTSDAAQAGKTYSVDTPPPYVSAAHLHVGHAMSYSQAEFVVRYKRMRGYEVFYPMGFDDNGLPTERYVEKKYMSTRATSPARASSTCACRRHLPARRSTRICGDRWA